MSATVIDMTTRVRRSSIDDRVAQARDDITVALVRMGRQDRIHQAKARVENLVRMGKPADESVAQVSKWARDSIDRNDPPPPKAA